MLNRSMAKAWGIQETKSILISFNELKKRLFQHSIDFQKKIIMYKKTIMYKKIRKVFVFREVLVFQKKAICFSKPYFFRDATSNFSVKR